MTPVDYFQEDDESSTFTRWLIPALIVSIGAHIALCFWAMKIPVVKSDQELYEKIVPRTFHIEPVKIDPKLLEPEPDQIKRAAMAPEAVKLPEEKVSFEKLMAESKPEAAAPKLDSKILVDTPKPSSTTLAQTMESARESGARSALEDPKALDQTVLSETPGAMNSSVNDLLEPDTLTGRAIARSGEAAGRNAPGFSNLDQLLAQTGPLSAETAPILMPTDLLFDYNASELRPQAMASLEKLGTLIQRNPQAVFQIEGHTDSFGPEDYNLVLSQKRAELVKAWLIRGMKIPADRVTAKGYGETRLLAPANGTIEEQQINRRVEIVIRTKQ